MQRRGHLGRVGEDGQGARAVGADADGVAGGEAVGLDEGRRLLQHVHAAVLRAVGPRLDDELEAAAVHVGRRQRVGPATAAAPRLHHIKIVLLHGRP